MSDLMIRNTADKNITWEEKKEKDHIWSLP